MKLKSTTYYWLAVIFGGVGMGTAMGAEGTAQTTGYISVTLFAVSLVLILLAILFMRLGFYAADQEKKQSKKVHQQPRNTVKSGRKAGRYEQPKQKARRCANTDELQGMMSFAAHHHKNSIKQEVLQVALLRIYDVEKEPPALVSQQQFPVISDAIVIADELANRKPELL